MTNAWLNKFNGTQWIGNGELWMDPEGNNATVYDCTMTINENKLDYTWVYEGETKEGHFTFNESGATWHDNWHQPDAANCTKVANIRSFLTIEHAYQTDGDSSWGWRTNLSERPNGDFVLQMTNIAPWGEEARAVRMIFKPVK